MILEFPEFLPDLPDLNNPGMTVAKNVIPAGGSYRSFPQYDAYSTALSAYCRGAFSARDPETATIYNFAGDQTKLYLLGNTASGVFDDISKVGGYSLNSEEQWSFTQFGDLALAANINTVIQKYQMGVDLVFSDLSGTPPQARYLAVVNDDFLVAANTYDAVDGYKPFRVRWAGIGSATAWTVSATTQADFQDLDVQYGWIQAILGGNYGVIIQEKALTRMDYIGSPTIFQFTSVETNQGTKYPRSAVRIGDLSYFIGLDGFRVFDGHQSVQIGVNKVDLFFSDDLDTSYDYLISSAVDYKNQLIMWAYPSLSRGLGAINSRILIYNYAPNATRRWAYIDLSTEILYSALSEGYTLEQLDDWESAHSLSKNIDVLPYSLDSKVWVGNNILVGIFTDDHKLSLANTATAMPAVLETAEAQITDGQRTDVFLLRPAVQGSATTVTVQVGTRNMLSESVTWSSEISADSIGNYQTRTNARYHRVRINTTNLFTHAIGVELLEFAPGGNR